MRFAIYIEDLLQQREFSSYKIFNVKLQKLSLGYRFLVNDRALLPPNVYESFVRLITFIPHKKDVEVFETEVSKIYRDKQGRLWIEIHLILHSFFRNLIYTIIFMPNRISFQASQNALSLIAEKNLMEYFDCFNVAEISRYKGLQLRTTFKDSEFLWINKNIESNEEQKLAIKNIVNRTSYPYPYCILGPPGE